MDSKKDLNAHHIKIRGAISGVWGVQSKIKPHTKHTQYKIKGAALI